jgi:hypothetical protein
LSLLCCLLLLAVSVAGCGSDDDSETGDSAGAGGRADPTSSGGSSVVGFGGGAPNAGTASGVGGDEDSGGSSAGSGASPAAGGTSPRGGSDSGGGGTAPSGGSDSGGGGTAPSGGDAGGGGESRGGAVSTGGSSAGAAGTAQTGGSSGATGGSAGAAGQPSTGGSGNVEAPDAVCDPPIDLADVSNPSAVIGDGTPSGCTEDQLRNAAEQGGVVTFDCGPDPVTIELTETIHLPNDRDTVIDGGGLVTLDAGGRTRHFYFESPDWMANDTRVVLQRLVLQNGSAPLGEYFPQDPSNPECAYGYKEGSGGALYMRDGVLHVIDCEFYDNQAALEGPDVGGGAIYAQGASAVVIVGSRFEGNRAANGGAVGLLFANPLIYDSVFENNTAEGIGMNYVEPGCPNFNHDEQGGAGGLSGAVYFDGMNDDGFVYTLCGSVFRNNRCNELGGALFRTPNTALRDMLIDRCVFDGNTASTGGVSFIKQNDLRVVDTLFMNNRAGVNVDGESVGGSMGGLWVNEGTLDLVNSTFYDNSPGGLSVEGTGTVRNATFVDSGSDPDVALYNSLFVNVSCESSTGANNLQWPESGTCPSDTVFADPQLDELGDHGGPTLTLLPAEDSPALGIGSDCPGTDQRGQPRPPSGCDAGAVER